RLVRAATTAGASLPGSGEPSLRNVCPSNRASSRAWGSASVDGESTSRRGAPSGTPDSAEAAAPESTPELSGPPIGRGSSAPDGGADDARDASALGADASPVRAPPRGERTARRDSGVGRASGSRAALAPGTRGAGSIASTSSQIGSPGGTVAF